MLSDLIRQFDKQRIQAVEVVRGSSTPVLSAQSEACELTSRINLLLGHELVHYKVVCLKSLRSQFSFRFASSLLLAIPPGDPQVLIVGRFSTCARGCLGCVDPVHVRYALFQARQVLVQVGHVDGMLVDEALGYEAARYYVGVGVGLVLAD